MDKIESGRLIEEKIMTRGSFTFDGQRHFVRGKDATEVEVKKALLLKELEEGKRRISRNMSVEDWAEEYLMTYRLPAVSKVTYKDDESINNVWIKPNIGKMQLKNVKPIHCQNILNSMSGKTKKHIKKALIFMRGMFDMAIENNLLVANPASKIRPPQAVDGTHRAITEQERRVILKACEMSEYGLWIKIMLYCGLRPGETARVKCCHINSKDQTLYIDGTKTKAAKRDVPIPDIFLPDLFEAAKSPFEYLFINKNGQPITKTNMRRMWAQIKKEMHIIMGGNTDYGELRRVVAPYCVAPDLVPYCLRHTYCTDLQAAGVPINVAKELMGHSSITMTANIYTHTSKASFETSREAINNFHSVPNTVPLKDENIEK